MRRKRGAASPALLPAVLLELGLASWEAALHRMWMMAAGTCTAAEYQRMWWEKVAAATESAAAMTRSRHEEATAALRPWQRRARANARRLRRKRRR
jgi:hypothetical protein